MKETVSMNLDDMLLSFLKGRQKYPASKIKVGVTLFSVSTDTDPDTKKTSVDINEWVIRSVKKKRGSQSSYGCKVFQFNGSDDKYVHCTQKINGLTYGKLSNKKGDYGFFKSIPLYCKKKFKVGEHLPDGIFTTTLAAAKYRLKKDIEYLEYIVNDKNDCTCTDMVKMIDEDIKATENEIKILKLKINKLKKGSLHVKK